MIDGTSSAEEKQSHLYTQSLSGKRKTEWQLKSKGIRNTPKTAQQTHRSRNAAIFRSLLVLHTIHKWYYNLRWYYTPICPHGYWSKFETKQIWQSEVTPTKYRMVSWGDWKMTATLSFHLVSTSWRSCCSHKFPFKRSSASSRNTWLQGH